MGSKGDSLAVRCVAAHRGHDAAALAFVCALVAAFACLPRAEAAEGGLRGQLRALAASEGLSVTGLDRVDQARAVDLPAAGDVTQRLEALLRGYNYAILYKADGRVDGVRILGVGRAGLPKITEVAVPAQRNGSHHMVDAVLAGPTGLWVSQRLMLDTGASTIVLPTSAIPGLGFRPGDLTDGMVETAGGKVEAKTGTLAQVTIGQAVERDVAVTFIPDEKIGQAALLGMSFLDRFQVTIDDQANRIILNAK
jgi:aspartyl protease family protein